MSFDAPHFQPGAVAPLKPPTTLRELHEAIAHSKDHSATYLRRILADTTRVMRVMPATAMMPPDPKVLRPALDQLVAAPPRYGIPTAKRASNIRAIVMSAVSWHQKRHGISPLQTAALPPGWQALREEMQARVWALTSLATFMKWCSYHGVTPCHVCDQVIASFRNDLAQRLPEKKVRKRIRQLITAWNRMAGTGTWPATRLTPLASQRRGVPTKAFAPSFLEDLKRYVERGTGAAHPAGRRRFDEERSVRDHIEPARATTMKTRAAMLRRGAVLLAKARGVPVAEIRGLAELVASRAPTDILTEYYEERGECPSLANMVQALVDLTRRYISVPPEVSARLDNLTGQVVQPEVVMTEKNRTLLRSLTAADVAKLFALPQQIVASINRRLQTGKRLSWTELCDARAATCLAILLYTPPRISNLAMIEIGRHLILPTQRGRDGRLRFTAAEMKGSRPLDLPLKPKALKVINWFIDKIRPLLSCKHPTALFAGRKGTLTEHQLRNDIKSTLLRHIGRSLHPHFFRHLSAHIILSRSPGNYVAVQFLLGHADVETTRAFYCGEEAELALQHVARCMEAVVQHLEAGDFDPAAWIGEIGMP